MQDSLLEPLSPPRPDPDVQVGKVWAFDVPGAAVPQGSMKATLNRNTGRVVMFPSNAKELKGWREDVERVARAFRPDWLREPLDGPVFIALEVVRGRSERDYLADGVTLRKGARRFPDTKPDNDKLERAIFDALDGIAYVDDGRIVTNVTTTRYALPGERAHVRIEVAPL